MNSQSYGYIAALLISLLGSSLSMIALPWFLLETTGDIKYTSIVLGVRILPITLSLFYGSMFIDYFKKKYICIASDLLSGILVIAIPVMYSFNLLNIGILLFLICTLTAIEQINHAALDSLVPDILKDAPMPRERLNGIIGSLHNLGDLISPTIAGLLITLVGSSTVLVLDGATFFISAFILGVFIRNVPTMPIKVDRESIASGFRASFSFIIQNPKTRYVVIPSVLVNFLICPLLTLILPYLAKFKLGSAVDLGLMISVFGIGTLFSSLVFTGVGDRLSKSWVLIMCTLTLAMCFFLASIANDIYTLMVLLFFIGLSVGLLGPLDNTILQSCTPEVIRGRVFLWYSFMRFAVNPIAMVLFGFLLEGTSAKFTFVCMSGSLGIAVAWLLFNQKSFEGAL